MREKIPFREFVEAMLWYVENPDLTAYIVQVSRMDRRQRFLELQQVEQAHLSDPSKQWLRMVLTGDTARRIVATLDHFAETYGINLY